MSDNNETKNAVVYCRVSTKEQVEEGNSLVTQERNCREYAAKHNYNIVKVFIERGESAKTAERTELQKLFAYCYANRKTLQTVIIYKIDRLSRNTDDYSQIRILLKSYGIEIRSTSEYFENTPAGRFMENIIANVAQFDNDVRTERSVGGMRQAVLEGRYVWQAPFGFSNEQVSGKSNIVVNEKSLLVKEAFEKVAGGIYSVAEVRIYMAQKGMAQKNGTPLSKSIFYRILKNELYIGWINIMGIRTRGNFEALISEELFQKVQRQIKSKKKARNYTIENPDFPLRRFVSNENNERLTGSWSQGRSKKYPYYRFIKANVLLSKYYLEERFINFLNSYALPEKFFKYILKISQEELVETSKIAQITIDNSLQKQKELQKKKQLLLDKNLTGIISDTILKEQLEIVEEELWTVSKSLESNRSNSITSSVILDQFRELFISPGTFWAKLPFEIKKKFQWFEFPNGVTFENGKFQTKEISSIFKLKAYFEPYQFLKVNQAKQYYRQPKLTNSPTVPHTDLLNTLRNMQNDLITLDKILNGIIEPNTLSERFLKKSD